MAESSKKIIVFTDGACSGNPGPGGWGAILISPLGKVRELGGNDPKTTNNRMELTATIESLRALAKIKTLTTSEISLYTDSTYVIQGITGWVHGWKKRGWKTAEGKDVLNRDLWEQLDEASRVRNFQIEWLYVPGHKGYPGNERCDQIAVSFAKGSPVPLFEGPRSQYKVSVEKLPKPSPLPDPNRKKGTPVYLSLVNGKLYKDSDWKACEARVKGATGARFKKVTSQEEETEILESWGFKN